MSPPPARASRAFAERPGSLLATAGVLLSGCGPLPDTGRPVPPSVEALAGGFRTLRAEHRVRLDALTRDGGREQRALTGLIAVERPDKLRLRALGPGGLTLFDLLVVGGEARVLKGLAAAQGPAFDRILHSLAADLAAAHGLLPAPPGRAVVLDGERLRITEPGREILLSRFVSPSPGRSYARAIAINDPDYRAAIEVREATLDDPLDPALFVAP